MRRLILFVGQIFICTGLVAMDASAQNWGNVSDEEWSVQPPILFSEANAVVLFDKGILEVTTEGISLTRHVRIKVFNETGAEEAGDVSFSYRDGDKITMLKAHTITPDGKKHKVSKKQFYTKTIGTRKIKTFSFSSVESGSILEYRYRNANKRFGYLEPWYFQGDLYTMKSELVLKLAAGFTYSSVTNNIHGSAQKPVREIDEYNKMTSYTWTMSDLNPMREEPFAGAIRNYTAALHYQLVSYKDAYQNISFIKNWSDLGQLFTENVIGVYVKKADQLSTLVAGLTGSATSAVERSELIYRYICDSIRTMPDKSGNYLTHKNINELVELAYGTADEKNILLVEMSRLAGLSAWPVLISTRGYGVFNRGIYLLQQFNHVIACVETDPDGIYLDASSRFCPYGMLPPQCLVKSGFLLDGKKSRVVDVSTAEQSSSRVDSTVVVIDDNNVAHCSTTTYLSGYFTALYGKEYVTIEPEEFIEQHFLGDLDLDYKLGNHSFETPDTADQCILTIDYTLTDAVTQLDNNLLLCAPALRYRENPFTATKRLCIP